MRASPPGLGIQTLHHAHAGTSGAIPLRRSAESDHDAREADLGYQQHAHFVRQGSPQAAPGGQGAPGAKEPSPPAPHTLVAGSSQPSASPAGADLSTAPSWSEPVFTRSQSEFAMSSSTATTMSAYSASSFPSTTAILSTAPSASLQPSTISSPSSAISPSSSAIPASSSAYPSSLSPSPSRPASEASGAALLNGSSSGHRIGFYLGVIAGGVAAIGFLAFIIAYKLRLRSRSRARPLVFPWSDLSDAGGSSGERPAGRARSRWWHRSKKQEDPEPFESCPEPRPPSFMTATSDPFSDPLSASNSTVSSDRNRSVRPAIRTLPTALQVSGTSIPAITQDLGDLQVANLLSGDISFSSGEASRASSALGTNSDVGTPREPDAEIKPRYLGLEDGGLSVPWVASSATSTGRGRTRIGIGDRADSDDTMATVSSLPYPGSRVPSLHAHNPPKETWTGAFKSSIADALNIFSAYGPSQESASESVDNPNGVYVSRSTGLVLFRENTAATQSSKAWSLEETADGAGVVHIRVAGTSKLPDRLVSPFSNEAALDDARSEYSRYSCSTSGSGRPLPRPPAMYAADRYIRVSRESTGPSAQRPKPPTIRRYSSAKSAMSVGSDMSRTSNATSTRVGRLSVKEEAARRALRERRKRSLCVSKARMDRLKDKNERVLQSRSSAYSHVK